MVSTGMPLAPDSAPIDSKPRWSGATRAVSRSGVNGFWTGPAGFILAPRSPRRSRGVTGPGGSRDRSPERSCRRVPAALDGLPPQPLIQGREADQSVHDHAQQVLVAERARAGERSDQVEVRERDEAPVQSADDEQDRGEDVELLHVRVPRW